MRRFRAILTPCVLTLGGLAVVSGAASNDPSPSGQPRLMAALNAPALNAPLASAPLMSDRRAEPSQAGSSEIHFSAEPNDEGDDSAPVANKNKKNPSAGDRVMPSLDPPALSSPSNDPPEAKAPATKSTPFQPSMNDASGRTSDGQQPSVAAPAKPKDEPLPPLTEDLKTLRDAVRQTVAGHARQPLSTQENTAAQILHACAAFGCDTEVRSPSTPNGRLNGVTCLCWNYPCAGRTMLRTVDGQIAPRVGYAFQEQPGQFLAVLALARVPDDYPLAVGEKQKGKVADLVELEKRNCRDGLDLSYELIGLARYLPVDATWKNDLGEDWSVDRIVDHELARSNDDSPEGGTIRLLALGYAVERARLQDDSLTGSFARADKYLREFQDYAWKLQNADGTWHPGFFKFRGAGGTPVEQLRSTGQIVRWLVLSLPDEQLRDERMVKAIGRLTQLLNATRAQGLASAGAREIAARLDAVHALTLYDLRVFQPFDAAEAATPPAPATERRGTSETPRQPSRRV